MPIWRSLGICLALAAVPSATFAQQRPPGFVAEQLGGGSCDVMRRTAKGAPVYSARFEVESADGQSASAATGEFCFKTQQVCERFLIEIDFDHAGTAVRGSCEAVK